MGADTVILTSDGHAQRLQNEVARMRERHALCDLTIQVSGGIEYAVHKVVLVAHSRYFKMQMDCGQLQGNKHLIPTVDASMFAPLLAYLYTGQLHITASNIWAIITAATQLDMPDALNLCEHYLQNTAKPAPVESHSPPQSEKQEAVDDAKTSELKDEEVYCDDKVEVPLVENDGADKVNVAQPQNDDGPKTLKLKIKKPVIEKDLTEQGSVEEKVASPSDVEDIEALPSPDVEDLDWLPNNSAQVEVSRKKRKQSHPKRIVSRGRGRSRRKNIPLESTKKATYRKWLSNLKRNHKCQICKRKFAYRAMLFLHRKTHNGIKPLFKPQLLTSKTFKVCKNGLKKEYFCKICDTSHKLRVLAESHCKKFHARNLLCSKCPYSSISALRLYHHNIYRHGENINNCDLFRCSHCTRTFQHRKNFINHIRSIHSSGLDCKNCGCHMRSQLAFENHVVNCFQIVPLKSEKTSNAKSSTTLSMTESKTTVMQCQYCERTFKYQKVFNRHKATCTLTAEHSKAVSEHHSKRSYKCRSCDRQFQSLQLLQEHRSTKHSNSHNPMKQIRRPYAKRCKSWECEVERCTFICTNPHVLTKHVKQHHPQFSLPCGECRFSAGSKLLLERHVRMRHLQALRCEICQRTFSVPAQLRVHKYIKHQIDDGSIQIHSCSVPGCKYTCVWKSSLKVHMQRHESGKPFACLFCDKKFKREKGMEKHINKVHKGIRPYMCDACGQSYGEEAELKAHMVRHNSTKQYKCSHCEYATHDKGNYQSHLFGMHRVAISSEMAIFTCNVCDYTTDRKHRYEMHMKNHMGIRDITCKICGKSFVTKNTLSNHIQRVHSEKIYTCTYCQYTTGNQHTYKEHVRIMHTHRDIKPYKCAYCDFRCHTSGNCRKHCANRHKGLEIKWVRLCELYPNSQSEEGATTHAEERPVAESNIKHISVSRRIAKDVLSQQQQMEQEQEQGFSQEEQTIPEQQQEQQQLQQQDQRLPTIPYITSSFTDDDTLQSFTIPSVQENSANSQLQPLLQSTQSPVLHIPQLPLPPLAATFNQGTVQMGSMQPAHLSFSYPPLPIAVNQYSRTSHHVQPNQQAQKNLTLL